MYDHVQPLVSDAYCKASNAGEVLGVTGSFLGAALLTVILRTYVRARIMKALGPDDYVIVLATLLTMAVFACFVGESRSGVGRHNVCVAPMDMVRQAKWEFFHGISVVTGVVLVKISIALFLLRLAPRKSWRTFLWCAIAFLVCFCISCLGTLIFACTPIAASLDPRLRADPSTKCFSSSTYGFIGLFNSIINILTDVLFAVLPIPIILKLQINLRAKISLVFILALGFTACAAGVVKATLQTKFLSQPDSLWHDSFNVWNMIELCLGILAASLPSLKPLFARFIETTRTILGASGSSRQQSKQQRTPQWPPPPHSSELSQKSRTVWERQDELYEFEDRIRSLPAQEHEKGAAASLEAFADEDDERGPQHYVTQPKRSYNVHISAGRLSPDHRRSMGTSHKLSRSESQERLRDPWPVIYKSLEFSRTTEGRT
ncbi:hypothetical protein LTR62_002601 [Meristemomyces frigidus]|uniref:Rhodopsin domain-containing protein n=1 Tax=Meristemomyces frigidus TaxID=1508187 RepID=A0AAN7YS51_9PEZI|nr:hypothetical protein LTR62_002601 [Meristemomyces frigidus]